jgi:hypothetical protein
MIPQPTPPIPTSGPASINTDQLQAWVELRRRSRNRLKLIGLTILVLVLGGLALVWTLFHEQFMATAHLKNLGFLVDWEVNNDNYLRGGTTSVCYQTRGVELVGRITPQDLESLRKLRNLNVLDLGSVPLRDDDLAVLGQLVELKDLSLDRALDVNTPRQTRQLMGRLTGRALVHLRGLKNLSFLMLGSNAITDDGLINLKDLQSLKRLGLSWNPITDAGLKHLANLQSLESLDLEGTKVTDAGLQALVGLKSLKSLRLEKTAVTVEGVAKFQGMRSDVEVIRDPPTETY